MLTGIATFCLTNIESMKNLTYFCQCNEIYMEDNVIPILRTSEVEVTRLTSRIKTLREKGLTHSLKKAPGTKKRKKNLNATGAITEADNGTEANGGNKRADASSDRISLADRESIMSKPTSKTSASIRNADTASLTVKVLREQEERNKRRRMEKNTNIETLFLKKDPKQLYAESNDFMSRGFTIPTKSEK